MSNALLSLGSNQNNPLDSKNDSGINDYEIKRINYIVDQKKCGDFIKGFKTEVSPGIFEYPYMRQLQDIANERSQQFIIDLNDLVGFFIDDDGDNLLDNILNNTLRYINLFLQEADKAIPEPDDPMVLSRFQGNFSGLNSQQVFRMQRLQTVRATNAAAALNRYSDNSTDFGNNGNEDENFIEQSENESRRNTNGSKAVETIPPELLRNYEVIMLPPNKVKAISLRNVSAGQIGHIVRVKGIVVRAADVKPRIVVATYVCDKCGCELYQRVADASEYTPLTNCESEKCKNLKVKDRGKVYPSARGSKWQRFQEVKLQETPDQVPEGHVPRSLTVECRDSSTRQCCPGDSVEMIGIFLPLTLSPYKHMKMGLAEITYLHCMKVIKEKKNYSEMTKEGGVSADMEEEIDEISLDSERYTKMAQSIAPEIYGHLDVKKALLLQLVSGVTKRMPDGMSIRGDINVLLMGDPGVAKSQLLKYVSTVAPRGIYTTGKGSSGVGLTACVVRDSTTGDVALEGGALVLSDMGICCIDEFDKMEESDRTAIHEVMEQQTVSIAKAGVTTTLNARTSVLAAANPVYGRYRTDKSAAENINLPAALLSRFDLVFVLLDRANKEADFALAQHITHVHRHSEHPKLDFTPIKPEVLRGYVACARLLEPTIPQHLCNNIVEQYVAMRKEDLNDSKRAGCQNMMTARQLLSILRMAQALARLRFSEEVSIADINEAIRLIIASKNDLSEKVSKNFSAPGEGDVFSRVWVAINEHIQSQGLSSFKVSDVEPIILAKGFRGKQLDACLLEYEKNNIIQLDKSRTRVTLVSEN